MHRSSPKSLVMNRFFILICLIVPMTLQAQNLKGLVTDENSNHVQFANVIQMNIDTTFLSGCITDENGIFEMARNDDASFLKVSFIGYKSKIIPINKTQNDLGVIQLELDAINLDEITVSAGIPKVYIKGDAQITNLENSILSNAGSANDVLSKIPGIINNGDGLQVFGKGKPLIYVNGRQLYDNVELEQLNSKDIQRVELVNNPGSRYDATVGAVIRIYTKNPDDGFGLDFRSSVYQSKNTDLRDVLNLSYRHKGWSLFGTFDYKNYKSEQHSDVVQNNLIDDRWIQTNIIDEKSTDRNIRGAVEASYSFNENHTIGIRYDIAKPKLGNNVEINNVVTKNSIKYDSLYSKQNINYNYDLEHRANLYYIGKIKKTNIDFNLDYIKNNYSISNDGFENSDSLENRLIKSENPVKNNLLAGKLSLTTPLFGGGITYGGQLSYTKRNDDYISHSIYAESSSCNIDNKNIDVFVEYSRKISDFGLFIIGCRYEHSAYDYFVKDSLIDGQSKKYDHLYPNLSFSAQVGHVQFMLSYAAKTKRPTYRDLRNSVEYVNRFTMQTGNPYLIPSLTHNYTLVASYGPIQFNIDYQDTRNAIVDWAEPIEPESEISLLKTKNIDKLPVLNLSLSASPEIGIWTPSVMVGVSKQWLSIESQGETLKLNSPMWTFSMDNNITLPKEWTIDFDISYQGKGYYTIYYLPVSIWNCDFSIMKSFLKKSLSLKLGVSDLFNQARNSINTFYPCLRIYKTGTYDSREIYLTLRYRIKYKSSNYNSSLAGDNEMKRL